MVHAIRIHKTGGPEVLSWEEIDVGKPGPGEVRLRQNAAGLNFFDITIRQGDFPVRLPTVLGNEGAGVIEELGPGVTDLQVGDRVAYCTAPTGSYTEARLAPADKLIKIPDGVSDELAAASVLKGLTAWYLLREAYRVKAGETILFHAISGGVGVLACQWARHLGVNIIGTCSSSKVALAKINGATHVIDYTKEDFVQRVMELTDGKKVPVVFDSVGKDTFLKSIECLAPRGVLASFGSASGAVEPFTTDMLAMKGALYVTRPTLLHYTPTTEILRAAAKEMFDLVAAGVLKPHIGQTYPLKEAAQAHRDLAARKTIGSTVFRI
ncbi:MAG TPA: quinone oxidoreductase [Stellaceae bacterium]|jgi:NADPH2:quinone reductase|nr:quinone oxidoreductase [Stellaceae bacterium]